MQKTIILPVILGFLLFSSAKSHAQEYKLRQAQTMQNNKMESTVYVKGKRQRVETIMPGMGIQMIVIEQCDLRRTIKLNDKKKVYLIEPFDTPEPQAGNEYKPSKGIVKKGGVITMWYHLRDTGERRQMFGFTARHIWSEQKIKPSADACSMKDSMERRTDGWYIDLPLYECHREYTRVMQGNQEVICGDKFVQHTTGKAKLGFPLYEKTTMIMGDGSSMEMTIETLELSTAKLDTMLFTIPPGYRQVYKEEELFDFRDMGAMMENNLSNENNREAINKEQKLPGSIRIGVYLPTGSNEVRAGMLQQKMIGDITARNMDAITISNAEEAKAYNCDYTLTTTFTNIKTETKAAGILKAIRRREVTPERTYYISGNMVLHSVKDGSEKNRQAMQTKYEGNLDEAAIRAVDEACIKVLNVLR